MWRAVLALADDHLILGHRLSEWCGHAPMLEEDLALPNLALDLIGTARALYDYAGTLEGAGRSEDDFAYLRDDREYLNCLLVERPNGDFAQTMLRQLFFAQFMQLYWLALPPGDAVLDGIAGKAVKEMGYHIRHSAEWVIRLGDGTGESAQRMAAAVVALGPYVGEMFEAIPDDPVERRTLRPGWAAALQPVFDHAKLDFPDASPSQTGGRRGIHSEHLGRLLMEMQVVHRAHPGATW